MNTALAALLATVIGLGSPPPRAPGPPGWHDRIDRAIGGRPIGVAVVQDGRLLLGRSHKRRRIPASNQKLLMSMALLSHRGPRTRLTTQLVSEGSFAPVIHGDVYISGSGDPAVTGGGAFGKALPFAPTRIGRLARRLDDLGVRAIDGDVIGSTSFFQHDWFAPGWKPAFPREEVPLPSALTFEGNIARGRHIDDPEIRAARALKQRLEDLGVEVTGRAGSGPLPAGAPSVVASIRSQPLAKLLGEVNRESSNFFAEVLGKRLGVESFGPPGTIHSGAEAVMDWASESGIRLAAFDASGLSYENRVSPIGLARLLSLAAGRDWGSTLRRSMPTGGQGTLEGRLMDVKVRAKTGTLDEISTLSGYVWLERTGSWAEFSIMSGGLAKSTAVGIEDKIVRILANRAA